MKIGMNLLLWSSHITEAHYPVLEALKKVGFDGVEVPIFEGDVAHYSKLGAELKRQGLKCSTITVCQPNQSLISADAAERKRGLDQLKYVLDMSAALEADVLCGPYYAPLGIFSGAAPSADEKSRAIEGLRAGAEHGKNVNVKVSVEFLCRFETYFLNTAADAADLVRKINHPNLGLLYDTFHANIEEKDPPATLASVAKEMNHFHISENDRGTPGSGHVQWNQTFAALRKMNYDGWLTIESFSRQLPELAAATRVWRDFFPSVNDVYERGLKFVRDGWQRAG